MEEKETRIFALFTMCTGLFYFLPFCFEQENVVRNLKTETEEVVVGEVRGHKGLVDMCAYNYKYVFPGNVFESFYPPCIRLWG